MPVVNTQLACIRLGLDLDLLSLWLDLDSTWFFTAWLGLDLDLWHYDLDSTWTCVYMTWLQPWKEALAFLTAVRSYRIYLCQKTVVFTDHSPLTFLKRMSKVNQKLLRWLLELEQYDLDIVHLKGSDNLIADFLSRPPN